jgi:hypothetical protein
MHGFSFFDPLVACVNSNRCGFQAVSFGRERQSARGTLRTKDGKAAAVPGGVLRLHQSFQTLTMG